MSHHVPTTAAILSLIGGVFILLAGAVLAVIGSFLAFFIGGSALFFYIGLFVGILTIVFAVMLFVKPEMKTIWGILIIVMSIVSLPTALGGFIIGFILALIGGILALTYKAPVMAPMGMPGTMTCPACGGAVNPQTRTCMACGKMV